MVVLVFNLSCVTYAQQNQELYKAVSDADQDAQGAVNQNQWFTSGCTIIGFFMANTDPKLSPIKLVGKSPEYVEVYTQTYKAKVKNLRLSAATPGCLTTVFSITVLSFFAGIIVN